MNIGARIAVVIGCTALLTGCAQNDRVATPAPVPIRTATPTVASAVGRTGVIVGDLAFGFLDYASYKLWHDAPAASRPAIQARLIDSGMMVYPRENDPIIVTDAVDDALQVQQPTGRRVWLPPGSVHLN